MIFIEGDVRPLMNVLTAWRTIEEDFGSRSKGMRVINDLSTEIGLHAFSEFADRRAAADAPGLGHMYEWGRLGEEAGRLWTLVSVPTGQSSNVATFDYLPAEEPTPREVNDRDTRRVGHVFRWKAPIMELGIRTLQKPTGNNSLAIPTKEPVNYNGRMKETGGTMWFTRQSVMTMPDFAARGSFTELWMTYFSTAAVTIVEEQVVELVEHHFESFNDILDEFPPPRVSPRPTSPKLLVEAHLGEKYGRRKNGQFMTTAEKAAQLLRAERIADGLG